MPSRIGSCDSAPANSNRVKRKQAFHEAKQQNFNEYGKITRPQRHPEYVKYRKELNNSTHFTSPGWCTVADKLTNWHLSEAMIKVYDIEDNPNYYYVDNLESMVNMCNDLNNQVEIAIDMEFDNTLFYHTCTSLIQISTHSSDYIIDPYLVFPHIKTLLEPILQNVNILKVVFSDNDVLALQRDFQVRCIGVVDVQDISKEAHMLEEKESLETVVKNLLGVDMNKEYQFFPWSLRPLPGKALVYARNDSRYLLRIWTVLKECFYAKYYNLGWSKQICIRSYQFPKIKLRLCSDFDKIVEDIKVEFPDKLESISNNFALFSNVYEWRKQVAKDTDRKENLVLSFKQLKSLLIKIPNTYIDLEKIINSAKIWSKAQQDSLLELFKGGNKIDKSMDIQSIISDIEKNPNSDWEMKTVEGEECMDCDDDHIVEYIILEGSDSKEETLEKSGSSGAEFHSGNSILENSTPKNDDIAKICEVVDSLDINTNMIDNNVNNSYLSNSLNCDTIKVSKLAFNRNRRMQKKMNRLNTDLERERLGLPKIIRKKHKGKKWRERGKQFRLLRRHSVQTTFSLEKGVSNSPGEGVTYAYKPI